MVKTEARIAELGLTLQAPPTPLASYVPYTRTGNLIFLSGHIPFNDDLKTLPSGKVGAEFTTEEGAAFARRIGLLLTGTMSAATDGNLDRIVKIVKLVGFVNCTDSFTQQPEVINGASNLFGEIFQERGAHARSAVGTNSLPRNVPVEIELIAEVTDEVTVSAL